jgi:hypothetical protein
MFIVRIQVVKNLRVSKKELWKICEEAKGKYSRSHKEWSESRALDPKGHVEEIFVFQRKGTPEERGERDIRNVLKCEVAERTSPRL